MTIIYLDTVFDCFGSVSKYNQPILDSDIQKLEKMITDVGHVYQFGDKSSPELQKKLSQITLGVKIKGQSVNFAYNAITHMVSFSASNTGSISFIVGMNAGWYRIEFNRLKNNFYAAYNIFKIS